MPRRDALCSTVYTARDRQLQSLSSYRESGLQKLISVSLPHAQQSFKVPSKNQTERVRGEKFVPRPFISSPCPRRPSPRLAFADCVK